MTTAPKTPEYFEKLEPIIIESGNPDPNLLIAYNKMQKSNQKKLPKPKKPDRHGGPPLP